MPPPHVLIIGGRGRIGRAIAADLLRNTDCTLCLTGRHRASAPNWSAEWRERVSGQALDLQDRVGLGAAIATANLVIHCAGPFQDRDHRVLTHCIDQNVHYLDVSDQRSYTRQALTYRDQARQAGITAIINTGVFPGLSNSMVRQDIEALEHPEKIQLSYVVAGSGGAGRTVMRTTFLGLQHPFQIWQEGQWQSVRPYSDRETISFPAPYGAVNVFWFDVPETWTLAQSFPVQTVITKFGSVPELYNLLTWLTARGLPPTWLQRRSVIEFLAWASYSCTQISDRFSGTGIAIQSQVSGHQGGTATQATSTLVAADTAITAGHGTGSIAQLILTDQLSQPGVWPVEAVLPTPLFHKMMHSRGIRIPQHIIQTEHNIAH